MPFSLACPPGYVYGAYPSREYVQCFRRLSVPQWGLIAVGVGLGLVMLCAALLVLWVHFHRTVAIIRKSDPLMLLVLLCGLMLCLVAAFMWFDVNPGMCALRPWLLVLGMGLVYPVMLIKQVRLLIIFRAANKLLRRTVPGRHILVVIAFGYYLPCCVMLVVWFAVSPFQPYEYIDLQERTISSICRSGDIDVQIIILSLLLAFHCLIILAGLIIGLLSGIIYSSFNESIFLGFSLLLLGLTFGIVTPLVTIYPNSVSVQFFVPTLCILGVALFSMILLFSNKFIIHYFPLVARKDAMKSISDIQTRISLLSTQENK